MIEDRLLCINISRLCKGSYKKSVTYNECFFIIRVLVISVRVYRNLRLVKKLRRVCISIIIRVGIELVQLEPFGQGVRHVCQVVMVERQSQAIRNQASFRVVQ